jgi:hypothetical protein
MTFIIKICFDSILFYILRYLKSLRKFLFYFHDFFFHRKFGCQDFRLVFVEALYQWSEINGWLKSCHDNSCYNIYNCQESSRVRYNSEECFYFSCHQLRTFIHLYINGNKSVPVTFVRRQILHYRIVNLSFYKLVFLWIPFK